MSGNQTGEQVLLAWPARVKMLSDAAIWRSTAIVFGSGAGLMSLVFGLAGGGSTAVLIGGGAFLFFMALVAVIGVVVDLLGGFRVTFALTTDAVHSVAGKATGAVSTAAVVGGALAGSMSTVGAGLLAASEKHVVIPYGDVKKVTANAARHYILVKGGFLDKPIGLYCTPEGYADALRILRERCTAATFAGDAGGA